MTKIKNWWNWFVDGMFDYLEAQRLGVEKWMHNEAEIGDEMKETLKYKQQELALAFLEFRIEVVKAMRWGNKGESDIEL